MEIFLGFIVFLVFYMSYGVDINLEVGNVKEIRVSWVKRRGGGGYDVFKGFNVCGLCYNVYCCFGWKILFGGN